MLLLIKQQLLKNFEDAEFDRLLLRGLHQEIVTMAQSHGSRAHTLRGAVRFLERRRLARGARTWTS